MVSSGKHRAFGHARGSNDPKPREVAKLRFETYNVRNLSDARLEGLIAYMKERNVFAMTIQETWRSGEYQETNQNFLLIGRGLRAFTLSHVKARATNIRCSSRSESGNADWVISLR